MPLYEVLALHHFAVHSSRLLSQALNIMCDGQVPKIGRRFVKPDDIAFIDITEYAPRSQTTSPYHMKIKSILPLLGDRVGFLFLKSFALWTSVLICKNVDPSHLHLPGANTLHVSFERMVVLGILECEAMLLNGHTARSAHSALC